MQTWRRGIQGTQALVSGARVLDALSLTIVLETPEQLLAVWERLIADSNIQVVQVTSPFAGSGTNDPFFRTTIHILLEKEGVPTIADALEARDDLAAAIGRAKAKSQTKTNAPANPDANPSVDPNTNTNTKCTGELQLLAGSYL